VGGIALDEDCRASNPANTDEVVARIPLSTREEMKEAIAAAKAAFPAWRETPAPNRGKILFNARA
jgi:malonate-semialdehyde dehydrogenase (acetylating)/methylmalonate-semialdehyde dehydrogenase